jgi:hypothetical protein
VSRTLRARSWALPRRAPPPPAPTFALRLDGVSWPPGREGRLTLAVGEVVLVLAAGPRAREGAKALLACAAGRRAARGPGGGRSLLVVDARRDPGGALAALLRAAAGGRAVLAVARVPDLAVALARLMLGGAALLRLHAARGPLPALALWSLVDGRLRPHARVAGRMVACSVAGASGRS